MGRPEAREELDMTASSATAVVLLCFAHLACTAARSEQPATTSAPVARVAASPVPAPGTRPVEVAEDQALKAAVRFIDEYKTPGLESELSGIYPHPTQKDLYYVLANKRPSYRQGQAPMLPVEHRGKLLTVDKDGRVLKGVEIDDQDFGGLVAVNGYVYASLTGTAEIVKADPDTGRILQRIRLASPAGGLEYDRDRDALIAQLYVGYPHLSVVDAKTRKIRDVLWCDESTMGVAKVDGDLLCTWSSGWNPGSFSELRVLDQKTGRVISRMHLEGVHSSLARTTDGNGGPAFMTLVTLDSQTGKTAIRRFSYVGGARRAPH
jgi:hypothetical protein